jgi:hypothetical protein
MAPIPQHITLTTWAAIIGMVLGTAGFVMSVMNYLRDRPKVKVFLKWDMTLVGDMTLDSKQMGILRVTNVGRRPIYISVAALRVPNSFKYWFKHGFKRGFRHTHLIIRESLPGKKLSEGDAPVTFSVDYAVLARYSKRWRKIRGYVEDSAGRRYVSKKLPKTEVPSWAK